ncbi:helix-turn-helix transcriptional regulator [Vibrio hepatarius]|uniref:helix-turn-helix transcriptional regulator n=1 Tax=Vibrio hepatarius TaxID=171383 RepID=UPI00148D6F39|nr:metalloregulator ArsR/SmtB family transcription factor [Vibrio hepatarius]NOI15151.1 transcriptional regulator [Vibrio hepatarius]
MKTTDRILESIKRNGAVTAKQLSEEFGMTSMGARQHLQALEEDGLLQFEDIKAKVGRPNRHWSLTQKGHDQFSDRHRDLTIQVIDAVEHLFGQEGLAKVALERENSVYQSYRTAMQDCLTLPSKLQKLVELRSAEGYMAELQQTPSGFLFIENHCPICKAATRCRSLCQSELNVFQRLIGDDYLVSRTEHIVEGERRCVYAITQ